MALLDSSVDDIAHRTMGRFAEDQFTPPSRPPLAPPTAADLTPEAAQAYADFDRRQQEQAAAQVQSQLAAAYRIRNAIQPTINTYGAINRLGGTTPNVRLPDNQWGPTGTGLEPRLDPNLIAYGQQHEPPELPWPTAFQLAEAGGPVLTRAAANPVGYVAGLATQGIERLPTGDGTSLGERINNLPGPLPAVGHFGTGALPFAALAPFGAVGAALGESAIAGGIASPLSEGAAGAISGRQALTEAGINAAMVLAPLVAAKGIGYLTSPEGRAIFDKLVPPEQRQAVLTKLSEERGGSLGGKPPEVGAGGEPRPAGDLLPSPPEAAPVEMVPPEHQELIAALREIVPPEGERAALLKQGRARQFGSRAQAIDESLAAGSTNREALSAGKSSMAGQILPTKTLEDVFTPERVDGYYGDVLNAERSGQITGGEAIAAQNALDLLTKGSRSDGNAGAVMPHEVEAMKRIFGPGIEEVLPKTPQQMTKLQKILAPFQIYRSFITAFDDSFGGGQGWKLIGQHPEVWIKGKLEGWKAGLGDEATAQAAMEHLRETSPNYVRAQNVERPLGIMTEGGGTNPAEEYLSPVTKHIPLLNRTERVFTVGGSVMRQGALDAKVKMWENAHPIEGGGHKSVPDDVFQSMIDMVNEGTLWGNIKPLGDYSKAAGQTFFSIRAKSALVQYPLTLVKAIAQSKDPTLRRIAARDLALWMGQNLAVLAAAKGIGQLTGKADVDVNPWSSNFGQITAGPLKLDIWQGYSPIARLLLQTASGQQQPFGYNQPKDISRFSPASNYLPGQLSPLAGIGYDALVRKGKNAAGDRMDSPEYWANALGPLGVKDTVDAFKQLGPIGGTLGGLASTEGLRVSTYGPNAGAAKANLEAKINNAGFKPIIDRRARATAARDAYKAKYGGTKEAEVKAMAYYDAHPKVVAYLKKINDDELAFWSKPANKALLKEAWNAGIDVQLGDAQVKKILGIK